MLLSVSHRFIFIHVNKAAGTSMQRALQLFAHTPPNNALGKLKSKLNLVRDYRERVFGEHATAGQLRQHIPQRVYDEFFKFAFVRNPWDWLASIYHYLCNTPTHRHHQRVVAMASFAAYVDFEIARDKRSQTAFICDDNEIIVDFVGRFETLQDDFSSVCRHIGVEASLPLVNKMDHCDYRELYDDMLIEKVARHWQDDIGLFAYEFDGLKTDVQRKFET